MFSQFFENEENVEYVDQVIFLRDKAPCLKALVTQEMLRNSGIHFFDNTVWSESSPNHNPCENIGAILKDKVDSFLQRNHERLKKEMVRAAMMTILKNVENDEEL